MLEIITDLTKAGQSDQLEDSINYVEVYELVESIMTVKHNLLERLGALIADSFIPTLSRYRWSICNGA